MTLYTTIKSFIFNMVKNNTDATLNHICSSDYDTKIHIRGNNDKTLCGLYISCNDEKNNEEILYCNRCLVFIY